MRVSSKLPKSLGLPPRRTISASRTAEVVETPAIPSATHQAPLRRGRPKQPEGLGLGMSVQSGREVAFDAAAAVSADVDRLIPGVKAEERDILRLAQQVIGQAQGAYLDLDAVVLILNCAFARGSIDPTLSQPLGSWFPDREANTLGTALLLVLTWLQRLRHRVLSEGLGENVHAKQELIRSVIEELLLGPDNISEILGKSS